MRPSVMGLRGLLVDFNGVLTSDLFAAYRAYCTANGLMPDNLYELLTSDAEGHDLLVGLETARIGQREFESSVAVRLGIDGTGMIEHICRHLKPEHLLLEFVGQLRQGGIRVGVVSNSLGLAPFNPYEPWELSRRFDAVVLSGEVGVRKPEPSIFTLAVQGLGVSFEEIVFVDDMEHNLPPATALGMTAVHHVSASDTIRKLRHLFRHALPRWEG